MKTIELEQPPRTHNRTTRGERIYPRTSPLSGIVHDIELWTRAAPFFQARYLVHRVHHVVSFLEDGQVTHIHVTYWCNGGGGNPDGFCEEPAAKRILCARCEAAAVEAGKPAADLIVGRHVHIGGLRAVRTCCTEERN